MFQESEIDCHLGIIKNTNQEKKELDSVYTKALSTLEILMSKLGLKEAF